MRWWNESAKDKNGYYTIVQLVTDIHASLQIPHKN